jgi:hypothetical protein
MSQVVLFFIQTYYSFTLVIMAYISLFSHNCRVPTISVPNLAHLLLRS